MSGEGGIFEGVEVAGRVVVEEVVVESSEVGEEEGEEDQDEGGVRRQ